MGKGVMFIRKIVKTPGVIFCICFVIINLIFTKYILGDISTKELFFIFFIELLVELIVIVMLLRMAKRGVSLEKRFLLLAIIVGILFIIILPPGQSPDDVIHLRRAYSLSEGAIMPDLVDGKAFASIPEETKNLPTMPSNIVYTKIVDNISVNSGEKTEQTYTAAALYNFVCYLPQTVAIWIGKLFNFSIIGMSYLIEIINFIIWIILSYYAIKIIPKFKSIIVFISLLPITIQEATSLSPDALTIGLSIFLVSFVLYLMNNAKGIIRKKELTIMYLIAILIGLCKIVYLPLILLYTAIPVEKFGSKKRKWLHLLAIFIIVSVINISWLLLSSKFLIEYNQGVDAKLQLKGIIGDPIGYFNVLFNTLNVYLNTWLDSMLGMNLGALTFHLPGLVFFFSLSFMLLLFAQRDERIRISNYGKTVFYIVFVLIFGLIVTSLYMQWTPVGYELVEGIQGRYFLPILLLIPVMINRKNDKKPHMNLIKKETVLHYSLFVNIIALLTIFAHNT